VPTALEDPPAGWRPLLATARSERPAIKHIDESTIAFRKDSCKQFEHRGEETGGPEDEHLVGRARVPRPGHLGRPILEHQRSLARPFENSGEGFSTRWSTLRNGLHGGFATRPPIRRGKILSSNI